VIVAGALDDVQFEFDDLLLEQGAGSNGRNPPGPERG
jgi:hypothetical protein